MFKDFIEYRFDDETTDYSSYDPTKINLGYLMKKGEDSNGNYISPLESKFIRSYQVTGINDISALGTLEYGNKIWLFYGNGDSANANKNIYLSVYDKTNDTFTDNGYIVSISVNNTNHTIRGLTPSLEFHTGGTVSVSGNTVTGIGTSWLTDNVCVGNRIGFGSTDPNNITTWYQVSSVNNDNSIDITKGIYTDGSTNNLVISAGTQYVIEDFRILYCFYASIAQYTGVQLLKGLRYELFSQKFPTIISVSNTVDNIRATYRLLDSATTSATFRPNGLVLLPKTNFSQQDMYVISYPASTTISLQKFNARANLTLTLGRSDSAYVYTTGTIAHNGTNTLGYNSMILGSNNNLYVTHSTRISRIPISGVTSGSTTFIADQMLENPAGGSTTFPVTNSLVQSHYLPTIDRFYVSHTQGTIKNYLLQYSVGGQFEKPLHINDSIQQGTYTIFNVNELTTNFISSQLLSAYCGGISFISRYGNTENNILYTLPLEADKDYVSLTNAFIISPEIITSSAVTYNKILIDSQDFYNTDRFKLPRESFDTYYRLSGITNDTGTWSLLSKDGYVSGSSNSIQFKFTFRVAGSYCVPTKIYGVNLVYDSNGIPKSTNFYEPSLKYSDKALKIFSWRQRADFTTTNLPNLNIDIYNTSDNSLLLTDDVNSSSNGVWQYSTDGSTWNSWSSSADTIGNYIRYSATTLSASGLKIKPILYI